MTTASVKTKSVKKEESMGLFESSLNLSNSEIKKLRASGVIEDAETVYRRKLEDRKSKIKQLERDLVNKLDLNATDANSLIKGKNFDAVEFYNSDEKILLEIHNETKLLNLMAARYGKLFNKNFDV